jgi:hypothetical protein
MNLAQCIDGGVSKCVKETAKAAIARFDADFAVVGPAELTQAFASLARRFAAVASARP